MPRNNDPGQLNVGSGLAGNDSVDANSLVTSPGASGLGSHVSSATAHEASTIRIDDNPPLYNSGNVEGALDELAALIPPRPPSIGKFSEIVSLSGIPDWGVLKLRDSDINSRTPFSSNEGGVLYPYFYVAPVMADSDPPFTSLGDDPSTDPTFNVSGAGGGGDGRTHVGGYTRGGSTLVQTARLFESENDVALSGVVYPADRGVVALFHWGTGGSAADFLSQDTPTRVVAAILLGQGITGSTPTSCDGDPGGIFQQGITGGDYDPFAFPGQASGQYDLSEILTGVSSTGGPSPSADVNAGRVRLQWDPSVDPLVGGTGIPVLGATPTATGGGNTTNFFRYRLPYLANYTAAAGLRYTAPSEKARYFDKPPVSLNPGTDLAQAGDYPNLSKDYWTFQMARFRHTSVIVDGAGLPDEDLGSFVLVHFKTEAAFESFSLTGLAPPQENLYSATLVDWTNVESPSNLADLSGNTASGYHVLRAAMSQTANHFSVPSDGGVNDFDYSALVDNVMVVSGVKYFIPRDATSDGVRNWHINQLHIDIDQAWPALAYRTSDDSYLEDLNPGLMSMAAFSYGETSNTPTFTPVPATGFVSNAGRVRRGRLEMGIEDLSVGAFPLLPTDPAVASLAPDLIDFLGDTDEPSFTTDGVLRVWIRRPLKHVDETLASLPLAGIPLAALGGKRVLFHSSLAELSTSPLFGNYFSGGSPSTTLTSDAKDFEERFLDESYRYLRSWSGVPAADQSNLVGPGLPNPALALPVPIRAGTTTDVSYTSASWLVNSHHLDDLATVGAVSGEAQVAGLPDRSPLLAHGASEPKPSSGILLYPVTDYTAGHRPSLTDGDLTAPLAQYDYSAVTGDVEWVRAFDANHADLAEPVIGQTLLTVRIKGLTLADFAYSAPGPGSANIAILFKIPGLTSWMDLGRLDGSGPSKQDVSLDGAGCQVLGPHTFDGTDGPTQVSYAQVQIHTGPSAKIFVSGSGPEAGKAPVLFKVILKDPGSKALDFSDGSPNEDPSVVRGLVGIEIVAP